MPETVQLNQPVRGVSVAGHIRVAATGGSASTGTGLPSGEDVQTAYQRGLREGEKKLADQLMQQRTEFMELQTGVLKSLRESVSQVVHDCERELVTLAIEVAQRLVAGLPVSAEMVEAAVREALGQAGEATEITVTLHPDDLALLQKADSPLLSAASGGPQVHLCSSADVTRGGCLAQTRFGIIDGRRETKLELVKKAVQP
jgi:flagellar assembly protein FliH